MGLFERKKARQEGNKERDLRERERERGWEKRGAGKAGKKGGRQEERRKKEEREGGKVRRKEGRKAKRDIPYLEKQTLKV